MFKKIGYIYLILYPISCLALTPTQSKNVLISAPQQDPKITVQPSVIPIKKTPVQSKNKTVFLKKTKKPITYKKPYINKTHFSLTVDWGGFSYLNATGAELEIRQQKWGLGLFGNKMTAKGGTAELDGSSFGLIAHYYFLPYSNTVVKRVLAPGLFFKLGLAKLHSSIEGNIPLLVLASIGSDLSFLLINHVSIYSKLGIDYISSASGVNALGPELTIGFKFNF